MGSHDKTVSTEFSTVASAPIPGGTHVLASTEEHGDLSLHQSFLDETGEHHLASLAQAIAEVSAGGDTFGVGKLTQALPPGLSLLTERHTSAAIHLIFGDEGDTQRYDLTLLRRAWPGTTAELKSLSTLIGRHTPELTASLEMKTQWRNYILGYIHRIPREPNAFEMARTHVAAQSFFHENKVLLGQTIRYIHDSLIMAFPYAWVPATEICRQLEERLDKFVARAPELAEHEPWIRECYRRLTGEMFVQRIHGSLSCESLWLDGDNWIIGHQENDIRFPSSPLQDLATLYRSIFWACHDNPVWCEKAIASIFEGYGEPILTLPFSLFVLDQICEEIAGLSTPPAGIEFDPLEFLAWFQGNFLANLNLMEPSAFQRETQPD